MKTIKGKFAKKNSNIRKGKQSNAIISISVIICSHNPKQANLKKVLWALNQQNIQKKTWELLLIDNASDEHLAKKWNLSWHPNAHIIREEKLGLTQARLRGIHEAKGDILIFVDDDNVLPPDYILKAVQNLENFPQLGIIGGQYFGVFEREIPSYAKPYLKLICVGSPLVKNQWSNQIESIPPVAGAGMVVRKDVARKYGEEIRQSPLRANLDRSGIDLLSGGDTDLCISCVKYGYGVGKFKNLHLKHLISENRLKKQYLLKLNKAMAFSNLLIKKIHQIPICFNPLALMYTYFKSFIRKPFDGQMVRAGIYGQIKFILNYGLSN